MGQEIWEGLKWYSISDSQDINLDNLLPRWFPPAHVVPMKVLLAFLFSTWRRVLGPISVAWASHALLALG